MGGGCKLRIGDVRFYAGGATATSKEYKVSPLAPPLIKICTSAPTLSNKWCLPPDTHSRFCNAPLMIETASFVSLRGHCTVLVELGAFLRLEKGGAIFQLSCHGIGMPEFLSPATQNVRAQRTDLLWRGAGAYLMGDIGTCPPWRRRHPPTPVGDPDGEANYFPATVAWKRTRKKNQGRCYQKT